MMSYFIMSRNHKRFFYYYYCFFDNLFFLLKLCKELINMLTAVPEFSKGLRDVINSHVAINEFSQLISLNFSHLSLLYSAFK